MLVNIGGPILRRGRQHYAVDTRLPTNGRPLSVTPPSSGENSILLSVSIETVGVQHLLLILDLINLALNFITNVVRYALHCRQSKSASDYSQTFRPPRNKQRQHAIIDHLPKNTVDVCSIAERLLSLCRPPKHLPGILASLLEASTSDITSKERELPSPENGHELKPPGDSSVAGHLVSSATNALASLASLYGGEHCRTALSAAGIRGFTVALGRSGQRDCTRLLLRILRRLTESDEMCLCRITGPAARHLHSVIWKLRSTDGTASDSDGEDPVTIRLASALLEQLQPRPSNLLI